MFHFGTATVVKFLTNAQHRLGRTQALSVPRETTRGARRGRNPLRRTTGHPRRPKAAAGEVSPSRPAIRSSSNQQPGWSAGDEGQSADVPLPSLCLLAGCKDRGVARLHLVAIPLVRCSGARTMKATVTPVAGGRLLLGEHVSLPRRSMDCRFVWLVPDAAFAGGVGPGHEQADCRFDRRPSLRRVSDAVAVKARRARALCPIESAAETPGGCTAVGLAMTTLVLAQSSALKLVGAYTRKGRHLARPALQARTALSGRTLSANVLRATPVITPTDRHGACATPPCRRPALPLVHPWGCKRSGSRLKGLRATAAIRGSARAGPRSAPRESPRSPRPGSTLDATLLSQSRSRSCRPGCPCRWWRKALSAPAPKTRCRPLLDEGSGNRAGGTPRRRGGYRTPARSGCPLTPIRRSPSPGPGQRCRP